MKTAIVVMAHNRPGSLQRLLDSLTKADYPHHGEITLVISIDRSDNNEVDEVAKKHVWEYGEKILIIRKQWLGLKKHFLVCGNLTEKYRSIIMLEDDLFVSPYFYHYSEKALEYYEKDNRIAGISLYNYRINETAQRPFEPIHDGTDIYFLQLPSSWGQAWNETQWKEYCAYLDNRESRFDDRIYLPENVISWPETSWKKEFIKFMVAKDKYFLFPRISLATNFGEKGTHGRQPNIDVQVPLLLQKMNYRFCHLDESLAVYDTHMEILSSVLSRFNKRLASFDYEVDLYGTKKIENVRKKYLLTLRNCASPKLSFSGDMKPHETCILYDIPGDQFKLCCASLSYEKISRRQQISNMLYDIPYVSKSARKTIILALFLLLKKIKKIVMLRKEKGSLPFNVG